MPTNTVDALPAHLRKYTVVQDERRYTPRDHAAWRYIMRQSRAFFRDHAVPIYLDGLATTGITLDKIPLIREMDEKLQHIGWGAVPVEGFIPPAAFLEFQARRILPIAYDMRTVEHIHYTPAPDIVHEAAGHAPILADAAYSEYLTRYAAVAQKAIFSRQDLELYEAIRVLSDVKENPDSSKGEIASAEAGLEQATKALSVVSEATKVARMYWWTAEYGLLGSLAKPQIYGAGLLSSVGESQTCLSPKVRKLRLDLGCVDTSYDITEPQPQLFVAESIPHLIDVLKELEETLAYRRGGRYGLDEALSAKTTTTLVLDSELAIAGELESYLAQDDGRIDFVKLTGPCQLALRGHELPKQGREHHPHGFSTPLGRWREAADRLPSELDDATLESLGLVTGRRARLVFTSGFEVEGDVRRIVRDPKTGKLLFITWSECTMKRGSDVYFQPAWGDFDMAVGTSIPSVHGGPADREAYGMHDVGTAKTSPSRKSPFTESERHAFAQYAKLRELRSQLRQNITQTALDEARELARTATRSMPDEWLLRLEAVEVLRQYGQPNLAASAADELESKLELDSDLWDAQTRWLVVNGLALKNQQD